MITKLIGYAWPKNMLMPFLGGSPHGDEVVARNIVYPFWGSTSVEGYTKKIKSFLVHQKYQALFGGPPEGGGRSATKDLLSRSIGRMAVTDNSE